MDDLMFLDHEGNRVQEPDGIVLFAGHEPEYLERVPEIRGILVDPANDPWDRFLACFVLTSWGQELGYRTIVEVAADPGSAPWMGVSTHRIWGVDDTFAQLAVAIAYGNEFCRHNGTGAVRTAAVRSLLKLVPAYYFDHGLSWAADPVAAEVVDDVARAVRAGVLVAAARYTPGFDLGFDLGRQLAELCVLVTSVDEALARSLANEVLRVDSAWSVREELSQMIVEGSSGPSRGLAWGLIRRGGPVTWWRVAQAFYLRHFPPSWMR